MSGVSVGGSSLSAAPSDVGQIRPSMPELEEIPQVREVEVWARLKRTSKYYHQGLLTAHDAKAPALFFRLEYFMALSGRDMATKLMLGRHCLHFNNNAYRLEDCELYLCEPGLVPRVAIELPKNSLRIV